MSRNSRTPSFSSKWVNLGAQRFLSWEWTTAGFLCLVAIGCGGSELKTVAVSGTVSLDDKPLDNGVVRFVPASDKDKGRMATGKISPEGKYTLATAGTDGVLPGEYKVSIQSLKMTPDVPAKDRELGIGGKESAIPKKFNDPEASGIKETIKGARTIDLQLKSK